PGSLLLRGPGVPLRGERLEHGLLRRGEVAPQRLDQRQKRCPRRGGPAVGPRRTDRGSQRERQAREHGQDDLLAVHSRSSWETLRRKTPNPRSAYAEIGTSSISTA